MKWLTIVCLVTELLMLNPETYGSENGCMPVELKCEYIKEPLGIDVKQPRLSWRLEDSRRGACQRAYRIRVASNTDLINDGQPDMWDSGKVESDRTNTIRYAGKPLQSHMVYFWNVEVWDKDGKPSGPSKTTSFETAFLGGLHEWKGQWISDGEEIDFEPAPYFRKNFNIKGKVKRARAYICGLGYFELSINGQKVGDDLLQPGYTSFDKTALYITYDITEYLKNQSNAAGVILGNGWYNEQSKAVWNFHEAPWRQRPKFIVNLMIEYDNGQTDWIISDTTWKVSTGPIVFNNIYSGEIYDARLEQPGWNEAGFDDSKWRDAKEALPQAGRLTSQLMPPIRVSRTIEPVGVEQFDDKTYVFDFGENIAGLSRLKVSGKEGTVITLKHGEVLYDNGRLNNERISVHYRFEDPNEIAQTNKYILKGEGEEEYTPRFAYHGFQYMEVISSEPVTLDENSLTALVFHTDVEPIGSFSCSNPLINKIWEAGIRSYLSNIHGIPTDCPHREKNGWTGDGHIVVELGLYNFDGIMFYEKWVRDFHDAQRRSGELPAIIPTSGWGFHWGNGPAWDSGFILIPWYIYQFYGDDTLIHKYYDDYKNYVDYLTFRAENGTIDIGLGDWSPYKTRTPEALTSSCYYYVDAKLLSKFAEITGRKVDQVYYTRLAEDIKEATNNRFLDRDKAVYANGSQTALSAAIYQDVVPQDIKDRVAENLVEAVRANDDHLDVGLLGSKYLLNALTDTGYADVAYKVASQETRPSWGWWILNGATTFQEGWGFGPSRNHVFMGEILAWFYKTLAGIRIDPSLPGFKNIIIRPSFIGGLTSVKAHTNSVHGRIRSEWEKSGDNIKLDLTIPANAKAVVYLPVIEGKQVYESGEKVTNSSNEIRHLGTEDDSIKYEVKAGRYQFEIK